MKREKLWRRIGAWTVIFLLGFGLTVPAGIAGNVIAQPNPVSTGSGEEPSVVRVAVADRADLERLIAGGIDVTEYARQTQEGIEVDVVATPSQLKKLEKQGVRVVETLYTPSEWRARVKEREEALAEKRAVTAAADTVKILRADYFENDTGAFLSVEAKAGSGEIPEVILTARWDKGPGTPPGSGGEATMERFTDAGVYMYHRMLVPVSHRPSSVQVTSSQGGVAEAKVKEWPGKGPKKPSPHYVKDFISHYMTPTEAMERIERLAREYPHLAEIIELPYKTNGYRRKAQAVLGSRDDNKVVITSRAWGHEGGNRLAVEAVHPEKPNHPLTVRVKDHLITVELATDASGSPVSSAAEVAAALNDQAGRWVTAHTYRGNPGGGRVEPQEATPLSDHLEAPDHVSRDPFTVKAIRIGKHRDGSRTGVLAYAQEHAREWVTPLVAVETAERMLRNYAHDKETRKLVDNLDIFIIPSVNPDGAHYSFYDYNMQRKNMANHCGEERSDPGLRNQWGVDVNRNYAVGSFFDGFSGASGDCLSQVYAGPGELSEPESRNVIALVDRHPNIKFAMNIHSYGGYFMWSPGAYKPDGRETLKRPDPGEEAFFWAASERILAAIREHRGTVILPGQTGPVVDVLYSAAGNSADQLWYEKGIFAWNFEVGADRWDPEAKRWRSVGFQPPFSEGHEEAMEFSDGLIELFRVALDYGKDKKPPKTRTVPRPGVHKGPVEVRFESSEPVTIYYTLDGSRPTFRSAKLKAAGLREGAETLRIDKTTTIRWFAVDMAGNIENRYDPDGKGNNDRRATYIIRK